ncbi:MAG: glycosyltransferase family 4 protein [Candidatus Bathyarchaeia archaeon]|jgi:glycosyltransferase involved in cell wall biosynthesis
MAKTRLCISTNEYLPHAGGIQKVVYAQNKWLKKQNYEPSIVTPRIQTPKSYFFEGVRVNCFQSLNVAFRLGIPNAIPTVSSFKTFLRAVKSSDIVHAHGHPYMASLILGKLAKQQQKPFVLTQHNTFIQYDNMFNTVERLNDLTVGSEALRDADRIIAVSNATKDYVLGLGANPKKVKVIHNGVDLERFRPLAGKKREMRRKLGIREDAVVVLTVRRIVYKNGVDTLIDAADIVAQKNPKVTFLVVGKGASQNSVQAKVKELGIEDNFRLAGFIADDELPFYYNAADFFVLPSKSGEGLPLVALEAMASGLPVVATDVGGISEVLTCRCGRLVPPNMPVEMAEAILDYSQTDLSALGREVRGLMEEKYSWEKNVESLVEVYRDLC